MSSRYVVGIDLGTTNSALAYVDTGAPEAEEARPTQLAIPQVVQPGTVEPRPLLPSFLYLPGPNELPAGSLKLPWDAERDYAVGEFARNHGALIPTRLVASAKSWLCLPGADRRAPFLPLRAAEGSRQVSPLEASTRYLRHMVEAWNFTIARDIPENRLETQEVVLTVPASFDAVARELTVEAARNAGLEHVTLLEEPQAAFYAWLDATRERWRDQVKVGDAVLIVDVGGGTTDLTLIAVSEDQGQLALTRVAVGDHILLGGDNMDLALAHHVNRQFAARGARLDLAQQQALSYSCRAAKEKIFRDRVDSAPITVVGRGRSLFSGTLKADLSRAEVEKLLIEGFFPDCPPDAVPARQRAAGLQELGLPYASDPGLTRHLAYFLSRQLASERSKEAGVKFPTALLFNGGVFKAEPLQDRVVEVMNSWAKKFGGKKLKVLEGTDLDLAVARGACYYALTRRGRGVRIRGGAARSYYIGIETSLPAIPGAPPPIKALCVVPFGMEEGSETDVPGQEFGLVVGEPVDFRFLGSSVRRQDAVGTLVEEWEGEIEELTPLQTTLEPGKEHKPGTIVPVHLHSRVTEVGTLELTCVTRDRKHKWKLEFNVRST